MSMPWRRWPLPTTVCGQHRRVPVSGHARRGRAAEDDQAWAGEVWSVEPGVVGVVAPQRGDSVLGLVRLDDRHLTGAARSEHSESLLAPPFQDYAKTALTEAPRCGDEGAL